MSITEFDIGNAYSITDEDGEKAYYIAVSKLTIVTYAENRFVEFSTKKAKRHEYEIMSVDDLCYLWDIEACSLDAYMVKYFAPDERAKKDARKRAKEVSQEMSLSTL
jgi:hypothetical protein